MVQLFGRKGKVLRNVYLPKDNGETSEVDVIFITQKGIFVFESKNYSGWIFGDEKSQKWTAMLPNKQKKVSWNGAEPKYDIRDWSPDHEKMGKGITLTDEEAEILKSLL
ncbi:MAG: NERD domain-containing protein [Lachnospiraceae bacterium]|nr:NERD domain-containing protein [Lachnospiraceae bacterium]